MRATVIAGLLLAGAAPCSFGQAKDTVYDLADITDKPSLISHPSLGYKDCYKDAGLTGTDVVKFVIDTTGHVDPASVGLTQVTHPVLDSLAVRAVRGMVFNPGAMAGAKVRVSVGLPVHFGNGQPPAHPEAVVFDESCVDKKAQPLGNAGSPGLVTSTLATDTGMSSTGRMRTPRGAPTPVQMRVEVSELGEVTDATVKDAGVSADLAQNAVVTARRMKFQPARIDGTFVASWVTIRVAVSM